jgi:hypothetical protein
LGLAGGSVPGSRVSDPSQCRVGAFGLSGLRELDVFFIAISHCAWRRVILVLSDKETKQRKRFQPRYPRCPQRAVLIHGCPKARCSPEPQMCETLLLANPDTNTLRPVGSRANTNAKEPRRPHALLRLRFLVGWLSGLCCRAAWPAAQSQSDAYLLLQFLVDRMVGCLLGYFRRVQPHAFLWPCFPGGLASWFVVRTNLGVGCPRIARGAPWAGSITGGEACGYLCSEKEGFTHPSLWRAPCFWGTHESKLHAVDT